MNHIIYRLEIMEDKDGIALELSKVPAPILSKLRRHADLSAVSIDITPKPGTEYRDM